MLQTMQVDVVGFSRDRRGGLYLFLALLAVLLSLPALKQGAWFYSNYDEWFVVETALRLPAHGGNPQRFDWPSLVFYLQAFFTGLVMLGGRLTGAFGSLADFPLWYYQHPEKLLIWSRFFMLLVNAMSVAAAAWMLRALPRRWALVLGLAYLFLPLRLQYAHVLLPESPMLLLSFLGLGLLTGPVAPTAGLCALSGGLLGLAAGAKYPAVLLLPLAWALLRARPENQLGVIKSLLLMGLGAVAGFFASSPFALLDHQTFLFWLRWQVQHTQGAGHHGLAQKAGVGEFYQLAVQGLGLFLPMAALAVWRGLLHRSSRGMALVVVLMLVYFLRLSILFDKYLLVFLPPLLLLTGLWLESFTFTALFFARPVMLVSALLMAVLAAPLVGRLARPDTRETAMHWMVAHLPPNARVAVDRYLPEPPLNRAAIRERLRLQPDNRRLRVLLRHLPAKGFYVQTIPQRFWEKQENLTAWLVRGRYTHVAVFRDSLGRLRGQDREVDRMFTHLEKNAVVLYRAPENNVVVYRLRVKKILKNKLPDA